MLLTCLLRHGVNLNAWVETLRNSKRGIRGLGRCGENEKEGSYILPGLMELLGLLRVSTRINNTFP